MKGKKGHINFKAGMILLLLVPSMLLNIILIKEKREQSIVVSVHDGDTFTLKDGQRVKLVGVDAPELTFCGGSESKEYLETLVMNKYVNINEEKRDTYGRRMSLVYAGSTLVNEEMLKAGWARADYTPNSQNEILKTAYKYASDNQLGIHSSLCKDKNPQPPSKDCVIKGNIDKASYRKLYHLPSCRHYNQIVIDKDMGEGFFCNKEEAEKAGFTLAPDCLR